VFCPSHTKPRNTGSRNSEPGISCVPITVSPYALSPRKRKRASAYPAELANAVASAAAPVQITMLLAR
jgi:hypothetical protein